MEITAKEIERQAGRVDEEVGNFYKSTNDLISRLMDISSYVKSDDSNLDYMINSYINHYTSLQADIKNKFSQLAIIMHDYASKTLKNEEITSEEVSKASSDLENINASISSTDNVVIPPKVDMPAPKMMDWE